MVRKDLLPLIQKTLSVTLYGSTDPAKDEHTKAAYEDALRVNENIRYILYGYTHEPVIYPIEVPNKSEVGYINTGTWRERLIKKTNTDTLYRRFVKTVDRNETPPFVPIPNDFVPLN